MEPLEPAPLLTTDQEEIIVHWAKLHADKLRAVLLYGSRLTGHRRQKDKPTPVPDIDLALSIGGRDEDRFTTFAINKPLWSAFLVSQLGVSVDFNSADPDIGPTVAGFLLSGEYKVLWYDPERWSPAMVWG
ncbi:hypothetical protein [Aestuariivirga sp.]|uniref:hypothetical protein n=1 Tax=Aestuariivirga sp. TaxID=2650926 RepID=UPI0039194A20